MAALVLANGATAADIGANDDTGKFAADSGAMFFGKMAALGLKQSVMTVRFVPSSPTTIGGAALLDKAIPVAELSGLKVVLAVYPYPPRELELGIASPSAFATWVGLIAQRYPTVKQFVVMNEPNQPAFLRPQFDAKGHNVSAARAGRYLAAGYDALKAVDPTIQVIGLGLSPRGNDLPTARNNISTSPVRFIAALGAWYRRSGRQAPLMDGLSFHPYPREATDPLERRYEWPNAGFADLGRIKQAMWDAFRDTPQPTTVDGLRISLDEVGWQVGTSRLNGYAGKENVRVTSERSQASTYARLVRAVACDPQIAQANIFGFYDDRLRDTGFQAALHRVDGTPRPSAVAVQTAIAATATGCPAATTPWHPAKRVIGAALARWRVRAPDVVRFEVAADEGATVVACILPGRLGAFAAAAAAAGLGPLSTGCTGGKVLPSRPARFRLHRGLPLQPVTVAVRLVAETSDLRTRTFARTVE